MTDMVISALVQTPFVLALIFLTVRFLIYLNQRDEEWRGLIEHHDERLQANLDDLSAAVRDLNNTMIAHDAMMRSALFSRSGEQTVPGARSRRKL